MRSHLTRRVFRRLLANQPVVRHRPLHSQTRDLNRSRHGGILQNRPQRRSFFGLFQQREKDIKDSQFDPGLEKMLELDRRLHLIARLPPARELVQAFRVFVADKLERKRCIEDFAAAQLLQTLTTLEEHEDLIEEKARNENGDAASFDLTVDDLRSLLKALESKVGQTYTKTHNELAQAVWKALEKRQGHDELYASIPKGYIEVLCSTGSTAQARDVLRASFPASQGNRSNIWCQILAGFSKEGNEEELLKTLEELTSTGLVLDKSLHKVMAVHFARKNNVAETKKWFTHHVLFSKSQKRSRHSDDIIPSLDRVYQELFEFCLRNNELEWGQSLIQTVSEESADAANAADEKTWHAIFLASAATGKSVEEIDRMVTVMTRRGEGSTAQSSGPSIHTLNGLIKFATSRKDAYTAERYFSLADKWKVAPNAETYIFQIEYRLVAGDVDGAMASYALLREEKISDDEDWPVMNRLLQSLIARPGTSNELVMGLVDDLSERKRVFPAETVVSLCTYHLKRDEYFEVVDLLQTYAHQFSIAQRIKIRNILSDYTLDPATDTGSAWDTYMIFHQIFDLETHRSIRNKVMASFFKRGRPDLGTHVFTRMNQHMRADTRPDAETYAIAFAGIAETGDNEALEVIHNLLKLDTETEPDTRIYNGLMLAYSSCEMPLRALEFWDQIAVSDEGPSYNSLHIAFRACERAPFGHERASKIWEKLRQAGIEITPELFASYAACLSGQGQLEEVKALALTMKETTGSNVDLFT